MQKVKICECYQRNAIKVFRIDVLTVQHVLHSAAVHDEGWAVFNYFIYSWLVGSTETHHVLQDLGMFVVSLPCENRTAARRCVEQPIER